MDQGNGTPGTYTECFQFFIAPTDLSGNNPNPALRPHVMNNSWTCPPSEGCAANALETIVNNAEASGIFVEVSAGNAGPGCSSVADPPSTYSASFSTGAIDINNSLANFSSRGPSTFYTPNLLKPNISAPGVQVNSSTRTSDTTYSSNFSGTSMAGPHVVGVVALLWSARPQLLRNIAATKALLQNTANPNVIVSPVQTCGGIASSQIPNNSFGYGRVDALAAVNNAPAALSISGHLKYQDTAAGTRNVTMTLTGSGGFPTQITATDTNGDYSFTNVPAGFDYVVTPSRAPEVHDLAISASDASQAARFDAQLISLTANQQTAGDATNNGSCTVADASLIARYVASLSSPGIAGNWKFTPASLSYASLSSSQTSQNLTAILVGDITGNWTPSGPTPGPASPTGLPPVVVSLPIKQDPPGGPSIIPVAVGDTTGLGIGAYSFDISFNQAVLQPQATPFDTSGTLSSGWLVTPNTATPGHLILNAFNTSDIAGQGLLINLKFNVIGAGGSTSPLTWVTFTFNEGSPGDIDINAAFTSNSPSAAAGRISGQIANADGQPVAGVTVTVQGSSGTIRAITNTSGFYQVENLAIGNLLTVTPTRANYLFAPANRSFSLVGDTTEAVFTATTITPEANPLESPEFFVRQQYLDFLGREPEQGGLNYWSGELRRCGDDANCTRARRVDVSAAFFAEREFQESGLYLYDLYQSAFTRRPDYAEYSTDRRNVVGGSHLEADKIVFAARFVGRSEFIARYPISLSAESFVEALLNTAQQSSGLDLSGTRGDLIALYYNGASLTESRSLVLRHLVETSQFQQTQYNAAFVLTEYFSYLGRNPDPDGYAFWLNVLSYGDRNNYRGMVCSFLTSTEYQRRFSSIIPRSNSECAQ